MILMQYTAFNVRFDVLDTPDCKNYSDNGVTLLCDTTCHLIDFLFEIDATINTYVLTYTQPVVESSSKKMSLVLQVLENAVEKWVFGIIYIYFAFLNILITPN